MGSCSAINTMYGGKKSKRQRKNKNMSGGRLDENGNIIENAADAITGTALGTVQVVKEGVSDAGSSMLNKIGSILSITGEKLKESGSKLYESVLGDEQNSSESTGIFSGGKRRRNHKSVKRVHSRRKSGGRKQRIKKTRRQNRSRKSRSRSRNSRRH